MTEGTKIYLAARYIRREEILLYAADLRTMGHTISSRWLDGSHEMDGQVANFAAHRSVQQFAREDTEDLAAAEMVISFTEAPRSGASFSRGGRHVEFGIGWAWAKKMVVVGPAENVFHLLPGVARYPDWATARANLPALFAERAALRAMLEATLPELSGVPD